MNSGNSIAAAIGATILWAVCLSATQAYQMGGFNEYFFENFLRYTDWAVGNLPSATVFAASTGLAVWLLSSGRVSMLTGYSVTMVSYAVRYIFSVFPYTIDSITNTEIFYYFFAVFFVIAISTSGLKRAQRTKEPLERHESENPGLPRHEVAGNRVGGQTDPKKRLFKKAPNREVIQQQGKLVNDVKIVD